MAGQFYNGWTLESSYGLAVDSNSGSIFAANCSFNAISQSDMSGAPYGDISSGIGSAAISGANSFSSTIINGVISAPQDVLYFVAGMAAGTVNFLDSGTRGQFLSSWGQDLASLGSLQAWKNFGSYLMTPQEIGSTVLAVDGALAGSAFTPVAEGPIVTQTGAPNLVLGPEDVVSLFHKGELLDGEVSSLRTLSTGSDLESVNALQRSGQVYQFDLPKSTLRNWYINGDAQTLTHFDATTGVYNSEIRIYPPASGEMNKFMVPLKF